MASVEYEHRVNHGHADFDGWNLQSHFDCLQRKGNRKPNIHAHGCANFAGHHECGECDGIGREHLQLYDSGFEFCENLRCHRSAKRPERECDERSYQWSACHCGQYDSRRLCEQWCRKHSKITCAHHRRCRQSSAVRRARAQRLECLLSIRSPRVAVRQLIVPLGYLVD